jgi:nucleotide-binding universal stress UspA family protein
MFKHILIPLDGSRLAEASIPPAAYLARVLGARITLFHVIERGAPQEVHGERHLRGFDEACDYLGETAGRTLPADLPVERHVHGAEVDVVARSIVEHAWELGADLIVMSTHGRGGLRGFVFGRIAQQAAGLGRTPILLVPPAAAGAPAAAPFRRMLVALDGDPDHEEGLSVAADLAARCGAELRLVMAVHTLDTLSGEQAASAKMLPGATRALLDLAEHDAGEYLDLQVGNLRAAGLTATAEVRRGSPPSVILGAAKAAGADLIVLATHGKTGIDAFLSRSATPDVASRSEIPLLLVPVRSEETRG